MAWQCRVFGSVRRTTPDVSWPQARGIQLADEWFISEDRVPTPTWYSANDSARHHFSLLKFSRCEIWLAHSLLDICKFRLFLGKCCTNCGLRQGMLIGCYALSISFGVLFITWPDLMKLTVGRCESRSYLNGNSTTYSCSKLASHLQTSVIFLTNYFVQAVIS